MRVIYSALLYCLLPLALLRLLWRSRREPGYRTGMRERLGFMPILSGRQPLWLHAVSVGEVTAALPLIDTLLAEYPDVPLVVSTATPSGAGLLRARSDERVHPVYVPVDTPGAVRRAFARLGPRAVVILETELWPNLIALATCPVLLLNARLSEHSARRYGRLRALTSPMLGSLAHIACQSEADAARFRALGAPAANVSVCGNLKAEQAAGPAATELARRVQAGQRVLVAGSTHEGEEEIVLAAFATLRAVHENLLLVLAPRHITRCNAVVSLCRRAGWRTAVVSDAAAPVDVLVLDTLGRLAGCYAFADVAFVGGSLVDRGGHNLLEPAVHGTPVVTGPSLYNFASLAEALRHADALRIVPDGAALANELEKLLADENARRAMGEAGAEVAERSRGALACCLVRVREALD